MNLLKRLFSKKIKVELSGNDNIIAIEMDPSKRYILVIKHGAMHHRHMRTLAQIDPKRITVVTSY